MKTIALKENNHIIATIELSTIKCLKSFHFGGEVVAVGMFKEGSRKACSVFFRVSYYQFILGIRLCHMFTYACIYEENMHILYQLHSTQQIELGYLSLSFVTLFWIFTFSVITRATPTVKGGQ